MSIIATNTSPERGLAQERGNLKLIAKPAILMVIVMSIALAYWLWFGLTQRSVTDAEGISILAAQGILEHGYSLMPSGFVYYRGYVPNYLLAGSIQVFGLNDFSVMLPGTLMALGSLWVTYLFGRDVFRNSWTGILAAVLLVALQVETYYATSGRMYMALQFFVILASYAGWRGYVKGEARFQWISVLAVLGAILSHAMAGAMLVALPVSVLVIRWILGQDRPPINIPLAIGGLVVGLILVLVPRLFDLPNDMPQIGSWGGVDAELNKVNFDVVNWVKHLGRLEFTVPFGLLLSPTVAYLGYKSLRNVKEEVSQATIFTLLLLGICSGALVTNVGQTNDRFWMFVLPIYLLLLVAGTWAFIQWVITGKTNNDSPRFRWRIGVAAALVGVVLIAILGPIVARSPITYLSLAENAYGMPCESGICTKTIEKEYVALRSQVSPDDIVISSNHQVTSYYLGRVDGWLREQGNERVGFSTFNSPTEEYLGVALIDSTEELGQLRDSTQRVWVLADPKINASSSQETRDFLEREYVIYSQDQGLTIYVNRF